MKTTFSVGTNGEMLLTLESEGGIDQGCLGKLLTAKAVNYEVVPETVVLSLDNVIGSCSFVEATYEQPAEPAEEPSKPAGEAGDGSGAGGGDGSGSGSGA